MGQETMSKQPSNTKTPPCPHCGTPIEGYAIDAAYIHTDAYTGNHALIVGNEKKPDGLTTSEVRRAADMDRITLDPCGDEISHAELDALKAAAK